MKRFRQGQWTDAEIAMNKRIESYRSASGGYTRAALAQLGVSWPPHSNWKKELIASADPEKYSNIAMARFYETPDPKQGILEL